MIGFREFHERYRLEESVVRKGAVAAFALQGKRHGDDAVHHFKNAKTALQKSAVQDSAKGIEDLIQLRKVIASTIDGLISMRLQIGAISAQITSQSTL
jgi:hypothetical protein